MSPRAALVAWAVAMSWVADGTCQQAVAQQASGRVQLTLVGPQDRLAALQTRVRLLLAEAGLTPEFRFAETVRREEVLGTRALEGGIAARAWLEVEGGRVRLYVASEDRERFVVRNIGVEDADGELGQEHIGQLVKTAVVTMVEGGATLTRRQVEALWTAPPAAPSAVSAPCPAPPVVTLPSPTEPAGIALGAAGFYGLRVGNGKRDAVVLQGPGLTGSWFPTRKAFPEVFLSTQYERSIPLHLAYTTVTFDAVRVRLGANLSIWQGERSAFWLGEAIGMDRVVASPEPKGSVWLSPTTGSGARNVFGVRMALGWRYRLSQQARISVAATVDVVTSTDYEFPVFVMGEDGSYREVPTKGEVSLRSAWPGFLLELSWVSAEVR